MGTRHMIGVVQNGAWKIAQYGQWDGYPSGQGSDVLKFLHDVDLDTFRDKVSLCRFGTEEELEEIYRPYSTNGWMTFSKKTTDSHDRGRLPV